MLRFVLLAVFGGMLALGAAAPAWAQACPVGDFGPAKVTLQTIMPKTVYVEDKSRSQITSLARAKKNASVSSVHNSAVGLTMAGAYALKVGAVVSRVTQGNHYCYYVRSVTATWSIPTMTVYIANNYPRHSCEYDVIREHEDQHVAIHQDVLQRFAIRMKTELADGARSISPYSSALKNDSKKATTLLLDRIRPVMKEVDRDRVRANRVIDTPESYRLTRARCSSW